MEAASLTSDPVRPRLRGVIHRWATIVATPLFVALIVRADGTGDTVASVVYALGVLGMLGVSATYHSGRLGPVGVRRAKRLDHGTILLAIAGSYTAVATIGLDGDPSRRLLLAVWIAAPIGVAIRMLWLEAPYPLVAVVYVAVGWTALIEWSALTDALTGAEFALVLIGGAVYTAGGVVYALHRPDPWPATFGYHEVFHALVTAGAACHFVAVWSMAG